ncbi:MAG: recombinase family protein [Pirellulaceae bacterium]
MSKTKAKQLRAAVYRRQSTTGEGHQEGSVERQEQQIARLIKHERFTVAPARRYVDQGISGWKRGDRRPAFYRMMNDIKKHKDVDVLLCDQFDRFSRADFYDVTEDVNTLRKAGVQKIMMSNGETIDLVKGGTMAAMTLAFKACAANQYVTDSSRRIAQKAAELAKTGRRVGAVAPYGYDLHKEKVSGKLIATRLKLGDPAHRKVVKQMFEWSAAGKSLHWIASELNRRGIKTARGKDHWFTDRVRSVLRNPAYAGDFVWNARSGGQFHYVNSSGEVVDAKDRPTDDEGTLERPRWRQSYDPADGAIVIKNAHPAIVTRKLFDAVQRRLDGNKEKRRRPRVNEFALSGILICQHCGKPLYGASYKKTVGGKTVYQREYRCGTGSKQGKGACGYFSVREDLILWKILELVLAGADDFVTSLRETEQRQRTVALDSSRSDELRAQRRAIEEKLEVALDNMLAVTDAAIRARLDVRLTKMREELDCLDDQLNSSTSGQVSSSEEAQEIVDALRKQVSMVCMAFDGTGKVKGHWSGEDADELLSLLKMGGGGTLFMSNPLAVRTALESLGVECRLQWKSTPETWKNGQQVQRHRLVGGRITLNGTTTRFKASALGQVMERTPDPSLPGLVVLPRNEQQSSWSPCPA